MPKTETPPKTLEQMRHYIKSVSPNRAPLIATMDELKLLEKLMIESWRATQGLLPSVYPHELKVALAPDVYLQLEADTVRVDGNPRPQSKKSNVDDLMRMRERGISLLDNAKGAMLVSRKAGVYVATDGLHSLRSFIRTGDNVAKGAPYVVRLRFLLPPETLYFDTQGDSHIAKRTIDLQTHLTSSTGEPLKGYAKQHQLAIAKNLNSFEHNKFGCDYKSASDEVQATHAKYIKQIEFVCSHEWLAKKETGYHTKSYVLATMIDGMLQYPSQVKRVREFITEYATQNYSSPNQHVAALLEFLKNPPLVSKKKDGSIGAIKGSRGIVTIMVNATSFWLERFISGKSARKSNGVVMPTDTSVYAITGEDEAAS